jgi:cobalamin biosynthetic protein CobC
MANVLPDRTDLRFFEHGGRLDAARAVYPDAPLPWIDLSTGISPWSYPAPQPTAEAWHRLPDVSALGTLLDIARKAYRAPSAAEIIALPGADIGICTLPWLYKTSMRVAVLGPTYSGHAEAWAAAGHSVSEAKSLDEAGKATVVVATNPNNPDGRLLTHAELAGAAEHARKRDGLFVLDEAFADANPASSILPIAARLERTVVLRSFGKFYGAAGLRLGFAITSHPIAGRLKAALGSWPISSAAIAYGQAALADEAWAALQRKRLQEAAASLDRVLEEAGLKILGGTPLFRLGGYAEPRSLFEKLARQGILVRPFQKLMALRVGLPKDADEMARLRNALATP